MHFVYTGIGLVDMTIFLENSFLYTLPDKSDKNGIFDVVTSFSTFGKLFFFSNYAVMFCYCNKPLLLALALVLYELNVNKKCQVSLVVKYIFLLAIFSG